MPDPRRLLYRAKRYAGFAGAVVLLRAIDLLLRRFGYRRTSRILLRLSPAPHAAHHAFSRAREVALVVDSAARRGFADVTCLRRSLALWWIMRWLRLPADVRLAFRLTHGRADGHAWVEHHGRVVNDQPDIAAQYPILYHDQLSPETLARL